MNILHTSDWHIGKRLMDRERLPEQIAALDEIVRICDERDVDLVLVAGDVFDTYMPSADAEEVFFRAVKRMAGQRRAVVLISGNHDSPERLSFGAQLMKESGIYIVTDFYTNRTFKPGDNIPECVHQSDGGSCQRAVS